MSNNLYNSKTIYKRKLHNTKKYVIKKNFPIKRTFRIIIMSVEEDSSNTNKSKKSWVWQYFNEETKEIKKGEESINALVMICQVKEDSLSEICGTEYIRKGSSTGNAISHLRAKHNITQLGNVSIIKYYMIILYFLLIYNLYS